MTIFRTISWYIFRVSQLSTLPNRFKDHGSFVDLTESIGVRRIFYHSSMVLAYRDYRIPRQQSEIIAAPSSLPLPFASCRSLGPCVSRVSRVFLGFLLVFIFCRLSGYFDRSLNHSVLLHSPFTFTRASYRSINLSSPSSHRAFARRCVFSSHALVSFLAPSQNAKTEPVYVATLVER